MATSYVVDGATLKCSLGGTCTLKVPPGRNTFIQGKPQANVDDYSTKSIPKFSFCSIPKSKRCTPSLRGPWKNGKNDVIIEGAPALMHKSKLMCSKGGVISILKHNQCLESDGALVMPVSNPINSESKQSQTSVRMDEMKGILPGGLKFITREEWGARMPTSSYTLNPRKTGIVLHQSDGPVTWGVKAIQKDHIEHRKFIDIGYHFIIGANGDIYEGRPLNVLGAHVFGHNTGNIGICFLGKFSNNPNDKRCLTSEQIASGHKLMDCLMKMYKIPKQNVYGHFQLQKDKPLCPGYSIRKEFGLPLPK